MNQTARAFSEWFGIRGQVAEILVILYDADGSGISARTMSERLETSFSRVYVIVHHLRAAMDCEALDFGLNGYSLTEVGMAECRAALAQMSEMAA